MVFKETVKTDFKGMEKPGVIGNKAVLEYLENIACRHADSLGDGINDMPTTHAAWILLDWKVKIVRHPTYGEELSVVTWSKSIERCFGNREFEIRDADGKLCVAAISKWVMMDSEKWSIARVSPEKAEKYHSEPDRHGETGITLDKMKMPESFESETVYEVKRRDIDIFGHMHNTYYLDLAYEALPEAAYSKRPFSGMRITYKKEIKLGEKLVLGYTFENGKHIVSVLSEDKSTLHSLIELEQ